MSFIDNPLGFMESNVVLVGSVASTSCIKSVKLNRQSDNVYKLESGTGSGSFNIYWCHYKSDEVHYITLGGGANFMFTARMNGCSFAAGIPAPDGAVIVAHANVKNTPTTEDLILVEKTLEGPPLPSLAETQRLMTLRRQLVMVEQKQKLVDSIGSDQFSGYLSSTLYQSTELTTFGVRDTSNGQWAFYFQARESGNRINGCYRMPGRTASTKT